MNLLTLALIILAIVAFCVVLWLASGKGKVGKGIFQRSVDESLKVPGEGEDPLGGIKGIASEGVKGVFASKGADARPATEAMSDRIGAFGRLAGIMLIILAVRSWVMQILHGKEYAARAASNQTREVSIRADRGRIYDRNGYVLVDNRASMTLVASKDVADDSRTVRRLANILGMPEVAVRHNIQSASEGAQASRTVMIDVPQSVIAYIAEHPKQFPGVGIESRSVRSYPNGSTAAHLLGYTGTISSTELEAYENDPKCLVSYQQGDIVGKTGVECYYDGVLQGIRGTRGVYVNASGDVVGTDYEIPAERGSDIVLTIDIKVQAAAEWGIQQALGVSAYVKSHPTGAACVVMDCKTGEVLAMASWPTFDPGAFIGGISTQSWAQLIDADANTPLLNRALNGLYPSASTIKPLTALAALEWGMTWPGLQYYCSGYWTGFGEEYGMHCWNHSGHFTQDLRGGIVNSCDTVFYEIARAFSASGNDDALQQVFRRWGLGSCTGIDLPGESYGRVPDAEWKWNWFTSYDDWDRGWHGGDLANIAIGQGDILVTPLQMAYVYCGLANGGIQMRPHVLRDVLSSQTAQTLIHKDDEVGATPEVDQDWLAYVLDAMKGVVNENSGTRMFFEGLPVTVMGKSGTGETSADDDNDTHAWFCAAAPYEDPQYVVAAIVEHGGGGSEVASHICRTVLGHIYDVADTDPLELVISNRSQSYNEMD